MAPTEPQCPPWASPARVATTITAAATAAATPTLPGIVFLLALDPEGVVTCHFLFLSCGGLPSRYPTHDFLLCITFVNIIIFLCQCIKVYTVHLFFCSVNVLYEMTECVAGVFM